MPKPAKLARPARNVRRFSACPHVYDSRCETLPPGLRTDLHRMVRLLDKGGLMARGLDEQEKVDETGEAKWCNAYRPVIEKYKDGLFESVR
jgi:hypothetical protein